MPEAGSDPDPVPIMAFRDELPVKLRGGGMTWGQKWQVSFSTSKAGNILSADEITTIVLKEFEFPKLRTMIWLFLQLVTCSEAKKLGNAAFPC